MKPRTIPVKIANATVQVPVHIDEATTQALAEEVNARIQAIQEGSDRIDTQAFALRAAYELAANLHAENQRQERETKELLVALDAIASRLKQLAAEFAPLTHQ